MNQKTKLCGIALILTLVISCGKSELGGRGTLGQTQVQGEQVLQAQDGSLYSVECLKTKPMDSCKANRSTTGEVIVSTPSVGRGRH